MIETTLREQQNKLIINLTDLPYFFGHMHVEKYLDWINSVEKFFDYADVPNDKRVKLFAYKLRGRVIAWWDKVQFERQVANKLTISNWERTRKELNKRFLPTDYEQMMYQKYHQCQ